MQHARRVIAFAPLIALLIAGNALAGIPLPSTRYVKQSATGTNNGTSWTNAYVSLQSAMAVANPGDQIWVAPGTYKPAATDRTISFVLESGVAVYGGFPGLPGQEGNFGLRDWRTYICILSGNIGSTSNIFDNSYHVVVGSGTNSTAILDGFIVEDGNANGLVASFQNRGGGLFGNGNGSPTIRNCTFRRCRALVGGAVEFETGSPSFTSCFFHANLASSGGQSGGAMFFSSASPSVTNCVFVGNACVSRGGAIYSGDSNSTVINSTFANNSAGEGGASWSGGTGSFTVVNCVYRGNTAPSGPQVLNNGGPVFSVTYSCINQAGIGGTGVVTGDPAFLRNPSPGGDAAWGTTDDDFGDLRLGTGSPCIDSGRNSVVPVGVTRDIAGTSRFLDIAAVPDTGSGTAPIVDMGAYETSLVKGDMNCDLAVNAADVPLFVQALLNPTGFAGCDITRGDMNSDSQVDGNDIQPFDNALLGF